MKQAAEQSIIHDAGRTQGYMTSRARRGAWVSVGVVMPKGVLELTLLLQVNLHARDFPTSFML